MSHSGTSTSISGMLEEIVRFIGRSSGLRTRELGSTMEITQKIDSRTLLIYHSDLESVLHRQDQEGRPFLQINLQNNKKILVTDQLIGFKPQPMVGLDLKKLPRVVTTPDLISVIEAIEECLYGLESNPKEAEMLKKAYYSIIAGAELVGFIMDNERDWINRLAASAIQNPC